MQNLEIRRLAVPVLITGDCFVVLDQFGRKVSHSIRLDDVASDPNSALVQQPAWRRTVQRLTRWFTTQTRKQVTNAWPRKADALAWSFRLRSYDIHRPRTRQRYEKYPTSTWPEAVRRLWTQGHNHYRYHRRGEWHRWACNVANNHNKRKGGRYAASRYRDRDSDHATD